MIRKKRDRKNKTGTVEPIMEAPDGGWGWVVVCGTFLIHLIMDGMLYSFGVFYVEFLDHFQSDKGVTSLIGSLMTGMLCFTGII